RTRCATRLRYAPTAGFLWDRPPAGKAGALAFPKASPTDVAGGTTMIPLLIALAQPANAFGCPCDAERARLELFAQKLAEAPTLDDAQDKALDKIALTRKVVALADKQVHGDPAIAEATQKLDALDARVRAAGSQQQVSLAFSQLAEDRMQASCSYTGVEILLIIIGFIFFIIPGIILLFLFC